MFAVAVTYDLRLIGPTSLKEKRRILQRLTEGLSKRFKVAVAEVGYQDQHRRTEIGVATVAGEDFQLRKVLHQIEKYVGSFHEVEILATHHAYLEEE